MVRRRPWLGLVLALTLTACGRDAPPAGPGPGGAPATTADPSHAGDPDAAPPVTRYEPAVDVTIDDASLTRLLAMHRQVLAAGDDVPTIMALGGGTPWNYQTYTKALRAWQAMEDATGQGGEAARAELARLDQRLEELAAAVQAATGPERERLQATLDLQKRMRPGLAAHAEAMQKPAEPETKALVERWKPRFDALEAEFAK